MGAFSQTSGLQAASPVTCCSPLPHPLNPSHLKNRHLLLPLHSDGLDLDVHAQPLY